MPTKGRKIGEDAHNERPYGPSWYDVYVVLAELTQKFPERGVRVDLLLNTAVNKQAGLVVWVRDDVGTVLGAKRFLDKSPESSKTAAGAFWAAITRAYHKLEEIEGKSAGELKQLDISEDEDDIPF